jgi:hypothetical protein
MDKIASDGRAPTSLSASTPLHRECFIVDWWFLSSKTDFVQTKREPKNKPNTNQNQPAGQAKRGKHDEVWTPPRGIRYSFRADRPNAPFYLHWREGGADGKRAAEKALGFADEPSREARARALAAKRESHGVSVLSFDPRRWAKYEEFQAIVGADTDPILVAHQWLDYRQGVGKSGAEGLTVYDAFKRYVELRKAEERLADDT